MLIVVLIIGITAAIAVPKYADALDRYRVEGAANRIRRDLLFARTIARSGSKSVTVTFQTGTNQYELIGQPNPDRPGESHIVLLANTGYPVSLTSVNIDGGTSITYDMHGRPFAGTGTTTPMSSGTISVASGVRQKSVVIEPETGAVLIAD